jgi:FlaA1/EpsC-like NDP-sugar epimerase
VVPLFRQQITRGGPVTITHPDVRRYFMTIPEAVQLVLQASALGKGGEVFVLEMGDLVRIADLAKDLIELSGLEVGRDIEIIYTGLRPGEKLFEEIRLAGEEYAPTCHDKIFVSGNGLQLAPGLGDLSGQVDELITLAQMGDEVEIRTKLKELVPEYEPVQGPLS